MSAPPLCSCGHPLGVEPSSNCLALERLALARTANALAEALDDVLRQLLSGSAHRESIRRDFALTMQRVGDALDEATREGER